MTVGETDPQTFRHLLHFLHTDELPAALQLPTDEGDAGEGFPFGQVFALLELAERYDIPDLKAQLVHRLHESLSPRVRPCCSSLSLGLRPSQACRRCCAKSCTRPSTKPSSG